MKFEEMPDKIATWIGGIIDSQGFAPVLMAVTIAILRVIYDQQETRFLRVVLEAALCGALALAAKFGVVAAGLNINWAVFIGGCIGYLGIQSVRAIAMKFINGKVK